MPFGVIQAKKKHGFEEKFSGRSEACSSTKNWDEFSLKGRMMWMM